MSSLEAPASVRLISVSRPACAPRLEVRRAPTISFNMVRTALPGKSVPHAPHRRLWEEIRQEMYERALIRHAGSNQAAGQAE
jgi:hypothetical protein